MAYTTLRAKSYESVDFTLIRDEILRMFHAIIYLIITGGHRCR